MPCLISGATTTDRDIANALQPPTKGLGGGLNFPSDWLTQCLAGTRVAGCTAHYIDAGSTMLVTPTVQTRVLNNALVLSLGFTQPQIDAFKGRIAAGTYVATPGGEGPVMNPRKAGVAYVAFTTSSGAANNTVYSLAQQQATIDNQLPSWWHNFQPTPEGVVSPSGAKFVPMLYGNQDYTSVRIASAVANAEANWIMGQGEPDSAGVSVAQAVTNWGTLVNDSSITGNPQIKLVSIYQAGDGSAGGSYFQQWLSGITTAGYRLPDAIALDRYSVEANVLSVVANYHAAFPTYELWIPEFNIDSGAGGGGASKATEAAYMQSISVSLDRLSYVTHYAIWYNGPQTWGGNNFTLRALYDNSAVATSTAPVWNRCGRYLPI